MRFDPATAKPRAVEAYIREQIRLLWGDKAENASDVFSTHGYFTVVIQDGAASYSMGNFRKKDTPRIVKAMKFLAGK